MEIVAFKIEDYQAVYDLWTHTPGMGLHPIDDTKEGIEKFLKRNPTTNFLARVDGKVVGTMMSGQDGRRGYIYHTMVASEYRKQGIASAMLDSCLESLKAEGISKVAMLVFKNNEVGNHFWQTKGFIVREDVAYRNIDL